MVRKIVHDGWCHYKGSSGIGNDTLRMFEGDDDNSCKDNDCISKCAQACLNRETLEKVVLVGMILNGTQKNF